MTIKSILLVQPLGNQTKPGLFLRSCVVEPLGIEYLAGYLRKLGWPADVIHPIECDKDFRAILQTQKPDIIGYSVYTYALNQSLKWAEIAKEEIAKVINIFGGYHPTGDASIVKYPQVDYVIVGEGEKAIASLLEYLRTGKESEGLKAVINLKSWNSGKKPQVCRLEEEELEKLSPYRPNDILCATKHYQLSCPPPSKQKALAQVLYSRGCKYKCAFCTSLAMWGGNVKWRSPESVKSEIHNLNRKYGTNIIFFADLCMNSSKKNLISLCRELRKLRPKISWWGLFRPEGLDYDVLSQIKEAGCVKLSIGLDHDFRLESNLNLEGIKLSNKVLKSIELAHKLGMIVRGLIMIGMPWETQNYLLGLSENLSQWFDELRIAFCCPFPGTKLFYSAKKMMRNGISLSDWDKMDSDRPIFINPKISADRYLEIRKEMLHRFFWSNKYRERVSNKISSNPHLAQSFKEFGEYLISHGMNIPPELINNRKDHSSNCICK